VSFVQSSHPTRRVPLRRLLAAFALVGVTSLGGHLAYYYDALVAKRGWLTDQEFLEGITFSNIIPGPSFSNFTVFAAHRLGGWWAVPPAIAVTILPGAAAMLLVSLGYRSSFGAEVLAQAGLQGLAAAAAGFTAVTAARLLRSNLRDTAGLALSGLAFLALGPFHLSLLVAVPPLALVGLWLHRPRAERHQ